MRLRPIHLFALALLVRIVLVFVFFGPTLAPRLQDQVSFDNETTRIATSIAKGYGYHSPFFISLDTDPHFGPTSWLSPVYPYFVAFFFWCFGVGSKAYLCIVLAQCLFSAATCIPILRIGEMTVGRRAGVIAAVLWAVFPWFGRWAIAWIWEMSLSTLLFALLIWFALHLERDSNPRSWLRFGLLWGFTLLVNPSLLTLLAVSVLWLAVHRHGARIEWLKPVLLALAVCTLTVSPWLIRNRIVFGQWTFLRTNFAFEFDMGNLHGGSGRDWVHRSPAANPQELADYKRLGELAYVHAKAERAKEFVRTYPGEFLGFTARRVLIYWDGSAMDYNTPVAAFWMPWSFRLLSILLVPALVLACLRRVHGWDLYLGAILVYPLPYYITFSQVRYRNALEPLMLLLIAYMFARQLPDHRTSERTTN
jgi:4-amino-4-deoxy-L-arabinose transferase-like glycosyltransferase